LARPAPGARAHGRFRPESSAGVRGFARSSGAVTARQDAAPPTATHTIMVDVATPAVTWTANGLRDGAPKTGRNARMSEFGVTNDATPRAKNRAGPRSRPGTTCVCVLHALSAKTRRSGAVGQGGV
jgi:hypothetical protein